jgi:class 3 adenylate cyclase
MARLDAKAREKLPDSAFAYIDSEGKRRLPINDPAHVRAALSRFSQVHFEDDAARDRARIRLLRAAQKHGVVPIGFISAQLQPQRKFPTGNVTFLLTDLEGSTELLAKLDDRYSKLLNTVRKEMRRAIKRAGGHEVDCRADELFAVFEQAPAALDAALAIQRAMRDGSWPDDIEVRARVALHSGRPTLTETGYVGLAVHAAARICYAAHGGQIVVSSATHAGLRDTLAKDVKLKSLGSWRFQGLRDAEDLFQVDVADLGRKFPPPRAADRA